MTRRAARITKVEVERLIAAVQARGLPVARVTFDGERVEIVTAGEPPAKMPTRGPGSFETLEEYEAWRAEQPGTASVGTDRTFNSWEEYNAWRLKHHGF